MTLLVEQFDLVWALAELHLDALVDDDFHWEPAGSTWGVHRGDDGRWRPDFSTAELDPVPVPTVAWLTWHIDWWWTTAVAHTRGEDPPDRVEVFWAGSGAAAVTRIREVGATWRSLIVETDPNQPVAYPWDTPKTLAHTAAWVNVELMKNIAEIGQLRLLRAAG